MNMQLRFTGIGGQGVLLAGDILSEAKVKIGGHGVKSSTYTSQVRGGPTKVDVLLNDKPILYPYATEGEIDFMLSTADVSYQSYKSDVKDGGVIIVDSNLVNPTDEDKKKWKVYEIPVIEIAKNEVGNVVTQSVVALALAITFTKCLDRDKVIEAMVSKIPEKLVDINKKAFEIGEKHANSFLNI